MRVSAAMFVCVLLTKHLKEWGRPFSARLQQVLKRLQTRLINPVGDSGGIMGWGLETAARENTMQNQAGSATHEQFSMA